MALLNRTQEDLTDKCHTITVPSDARARLMYYLDCVCTVLRMADDEDINRFRRYSNYNTLSQSDTKLLIRLCVLLKPDVLLDKCIFQNDGLCGISESKFYDLEATSHNLLIAGSVNGGQNKQVTKIMTVTTKWLSENWANPLHILRDRQKKIEGRQIQEKIETRQRQRQERTKSRERQEGIEDRIEREEIQESVAAARRKPSEFCIIL